MIALGILGYITIGSLACFICFKIKTLDKDEIMEGLWITLLWPIGLLFLPFVGLIFLIETLSDLANPPELTSEQQFNKKLEKTIK